MLRTRSDHLFCAFLYWQASARSQDPIYLLLYGWLALVPLPCIVHSSTLQCAPCPRISDNPSVLNWHPRCLLYLYVRVCILLLLLCTSKSRNPISRARSTAKGAILFLQKRHHDTRKAYIYKFESSRDNRRKRWTIISIRTKARSVVEGGEGGGAPVTRSWISGWWVTKGKVLWTTPGIPSRFAY